MKILFDRPAEDMLEALPVGNGRLGALVYGQVLREQAVLNENSMWSGSQEQADREDAAAYLPRIRKLLAEGKNYEAAKVVCRQDFTCKGKGTNYAHGSTVPFGCYQKTLGRLNLSYFQAISSGRQDSCGATDYERFLDLDTGIAKVRFRLGGKEYVERMAGILGSGGHMAASVRFRTGTDQRFLRPGSGRAFPCGETAFAAASGPVDERTAGRRLWDG